MTISNSIYKGKNQFASEFFCPNCFAIRPYERARMSEETTRYAGPFLEKNETEHVVVCKSCKTAFAPDILERNVQSLFKLVVAAKNQLDGGISPGFLKIRLISDGLAEGFVDSLLSAALH
jgi:hypothetical protein